MTLFDLASFVFHPIAFPTEIESRRNGPDKTDFVPLYRIHVTCRCDDVAHIEFLLRQSLGLNCGVIEVFDRATKNDADSTVFDVKVRCEDHVRSHLVKVVSRLGLEPSVRSVSWDPIVKKPM